MSDHLAHGLLHETFSYDPETGILWWLKCESNRARGKRAGVSRQGAKSDHTKYRHVQIGHQKYREHKIIWLYMTGHWPVPGEEIDHINDGTDNRWSNLRLVTKSQNQFNRKLNANNSSGYKGVFWKTPNNKWVAIIGFRGKRISLGSFDNKEEAAEVYRAKAQELHGEFARL